MGRKLLSSYLWLAFAVAGLAFLANVGGWTRTIDGKLWDAATRLRPLPSALSDAYRQVALIEIDAATLREWGDWRQHPERLAALIRQVNSASPTAIALDLGFPRDQPGDEELAAAIEQTSVVILAEALPSQRLPNGVVPTKRLADVAFGVGLAILGDDTGDAVVREVPPYLVLLC